MAKRELSDDYRLGIQRARKMLGRLQEEAKLDVIVMIDFPEQLRAELEQAPADVRCGMEDYLACFVRMMIEGHSMPIVGNYDPTDELEDPEDFYGVGVS
ncbi:hypothetical protein BK015_25115 [Burkholderia pseudomallei]|uniref:hypothetical protein n=1 Tax=Burkholderia pseudomallei TaxID=28450 RepID=UPI0008FF5CA9|nr:hypothetical protein [Burkholderia pseudomallei]APD38436.1 hypothetical protein BK015_25115 [Burkholderia pseudomallei]